MKLRFAPRRLQNLPNGYSLDVGDYQDLNKYREEIMRKMRLKNKIKLCSLFTNVHES